MKRFSQSLLLIAPLVSASAWSEPDRVMADHAISRTQQSLETKLENRRAQAWGLRAEEWTRYRELMRGPLGVYSPHLDPLTALGIEARSDDERRRYAEQQVQAEAARVEKLLGYQRAYDAAWQRLFPSLQPLERWYAAPASHALSARSPERLSVFVKADCPACMQRVKHLQAQGTPFDLYLIDSANDDARLRRWAQQAAIQADTVKRRAITLNHDGGRWAALGIAGELPAVVRQVNGQWQRLE